MMNRAHKTSKRCTHPNAVAGRLLALVGQNLGTDEQICVSRAPLLRRARVPIQQQDVDC